MFAHRVNTHRTEAREIREEAVELVFLSNPDQCHRVHKIILSVGQNPPFSGCADGT
jgi:hypothetical protein